VNVLKGVLDKIGLDPGRVKIVWCAASEGEIFAKDLKEFIAELKALGPIGTELKTEGTEQKDIRSENNTEKQTAADTGKSVEVMEP
jgi:heterodisulfide reductase subunit A